MKAFSPSLQQKIDTLLQKREGTSLGRLNFSSKLILAPMAGITTPPFRRLMEDLGSGGAMTELVSCHGINYKNQKTLKMLEIHTSEKMTGIQLFGEDPKAMAEAAKISLDFNPKFIDINMGCPVRKVVGKGGGSALMKDPKKLPELFSSMKKAVDIPVTIKIRKGYDQETLTAKEVLHIAKEEGIEFASLHGRTRAEQYTGKADWDFIENLAKEKILPLVGNGDLHSPKLVEEKLNHTNCDALMLGRGPIRNPFIFLESLDQDSEITFLPSDYLEVIHRLLSYSEEYIDRDRTLLVQMRKLIVWFATGFPGTAKFRGNIFKTKDLAESMKLTEEFFGSLENANKMLNPDEAFLTGGHG